MAMDYWEGLFLPSAIRHPLNAPSHDQEHVNLCSTALAQSENLITFWIVMIAVLRQSLSDHAWPPDAWLSDRPFRNGNPRL